MTGDCFRYSPFLSDAELTFAGADVSYAAFVVAARKRLKAAFTPEQRVAGAPEHILGFAPAQAPALAAPPELPAGPQTRRLGYL